VLVLIGQGTVRTVSLNPTLSRREKEDRRRLFPGHPRRYSAAMEHPPDPTLTDLFRGFFGIGIVGFGGVLPWARRMIVEQRGWLSAAEFLDLLALCQFLPGPNIVNLTVALGSRYRGVPGALAGLAGLLAAPVAIVLTLGGLYEQYGGLPVVQHAFAGLAAAASGLVVALACRIAWPLRARPLGVAIAIVAFIALAIGRLPMLPTMAALAPVSILLHRRTNP